MGSQINLLHETKKNRKGNEKNYKQKTKLLKRNGTITDYEVGLGVLFAEMAYTSISSLVSNVVSR